MAKPKLPEPTEKDWEGPQVETFGPNPAAEERAEGIVRRLEQFIRDNRTPEGGMRFRKWREMAFQEITDAVRDAENEWRRDQRFVDRFFWTSASALVTLGFWGVVVAVQHAPDRQSVALYLIGAGALLFALLSAWGVRRINKFYKAGERRRLFHRVRSLDARLRQLIRHLEKRIESLEETLDELAETGKRAKRAPGPPSGIS